MYGVGKAKYLVTYYTGKKYPDGSYFYDIKLFSNKKKKDLFIKQLKEKYQNENSGVLSLLLVD